MSGSIPLLRLYALMTQIGQLYTLLHTHTNKCVVLEYFQACGVCANKMRCDQSRKVRRKVNEFNGIGHTDLEARGRLYC